MAGSLLKGKWRIFKFLRQVTGFPSPNWDVSGCIASVKYWANIVGMTKVRCIIWYQIYTRPSVNYTKDWLDHSFFFPDSCVVWKRVSLWMWSLCTPPPKDPYWKKYISKISMIVGKYKSFWPKREPREAWTTLWAFRREVSSLAVWEDIQVT